MVHKGTPLSPEIWGSRIWQNRKVGSQKSGHFWKTLKFGLISGAFLTGNCDFSMTKMDPVIHQNPFLWSKMKKWEFSWFHHWHFWFSLSKNSLFFSNIHHVQLFSIFLKTWKSTFFHHASPSSMSTQKKKHGVKTILRFFWKNFFFISWRRLFTEFITTLKTSLAQKKIFSQKNVLFHVNLLIIDRIFLVCSEM